MCIRDSAKRGRAKTAHTNRSQFSVFAELIASFVPPSTSSDQCRCEQPPELEGYLPEIEDSLRLNPSQRSSLTCAQTVSSQPTIRRVGSVSFNVCRADIVLLRCRGERSATKEDTSAARPGSRTATADGADASRTTVELLPNQATPDYRNCIWPSLE